jgi:hypothetical protein
VLGAHFGLSEGVLRRVFPGSDGVQGMGGLIQAWDDRS